MTGALSDGGEGWQIGCSMGAAWIPSEALTEAEALQLADERMYANKAGRSSPSQQVTDALLAVLAEQNMILDDHVERVAELARGSHERSASPTSRSAHPPRGAAARHRQDRDPGRDPQQAGAAGRREWAFIRQHPLIGERIVLAAPALALTAPLIRSSHERYDGRATPTACAVRRSRSAPGSSPSATPTT